MMFKSLTGLVSDVVETTVAIAGIPVTVARVITNPMARVAKASAKEIKELVDEVVE